MPHTWSLKEAKNGHLGEKSAWGVVCISAVHEFVQEQCCEAREAFTEWKLSVAITLNQTIWSGPIPAQSDRSKLQATPLLPPHGDEVQEKWSHIVLKIRLQQANPSEMFDLLSKQLALHQASPHFSLQTNPKVPTEVKRGAERKQEGKCDESRADKQIQILWLVPRVTWTDAYLSQRA